MDALVLSARFVLAVVFLVASVGKFLDLTGSKQALEEFGVPARMARLAGLALPAAELVVAGALLIRPTAVWGAVGALLLLLVFVLGVARAMSQGRAPDCHCFGQIHSEPAGRSTLIRNAVLAAPAVLIIAGGTGPSLDGGLGSLNGTEVALVATSVSAAILAVVAAQLWSDKRRLQRDLDRVLAAREPAGLPRGTSAPEFALRTVRGTAGSLSELLAPGKPAVLTFVSTGCGPCLQMLPTLGRWQQSLNESLTLTAIFSGEQAEVTRLAEENDLAGALTQDAEETFNLYGLRATPTAVLISPDGIIAGAPAEGVPAIEALIRSALATSTGAALVVHSG